MKKSVFRLGPVRYGMMSKWDLEEARWAYLCGNSKRAGKLLRRVIRDIVPEPDPDSEEYRNGEEKAEEDWDYEQAEEETREEIVEGRVDGVGPDWNGPDYPRDEDGYLVR